MPKSILKSVYYDRKVYDRIEDVAVSIAKNFNDLNPNIEKTTNFWVYQILKRKPKSKKIKYRVKKIKKGILLKFIIK